MPVPSSSPDPTQMSTGSLIAVGSYTHTTAVGIQLFELAADGGLVERSSVASIEHGSFLARHPHLDVDYEENTERGRFAFELPRP